MTYGWESIEEKFRKAIKRREQEVEMRRGITPYPEVQPQYAIRSYEGEWPPKPLPIKETLQSEYAMKAKYRPELIIAEAAAWGVFGGPGVSVAKAGWALGGRMMAKGGLEKAGGIALRTAVAPIIPEKPIRLGLQKLGIAKALVPRPVAELPQRTLTHDYEQLLRGHQLARARNLVNKKTGVPTPTYRKLAETYTGKSSMKDMTRQEADNFISALESLTARGGKPPKIPKIRTVIPSELMEKMPLLHEVGAKERFRQIPQVLRKIGLYEEFWNPMLEREVLRIEELAVFHKEKAIFANMIGKNTASKVRIVEALEDPLKAHLLNREEQQVFSWYRKFTENWAKRLGMKPEEMRKNYFTHTFERAIEQDIKAKHPLDPELIKALDFNFAKKVFNPFLQKRIGANVGLKQDPFAAAEAYEQYALRQYYYQPLVKKITAYEPFVQEFAGPNAGRQFRALANRLAGRPDAFDGEINYSLKEFAGAMNKIPFIRKVLGDRMTALMQTGNPSAALAYNYASLLYQAFLGLRPVSAIRNLSQNLLTVSHVGVGNFAGGLGLRLTAEGKRALSESLVLRSRAISYLPGVETGTLGMWTKRGQNVALWMFKRADRENVSNAFLSGYTWGKKLGMSKEWAIKLGDEVATDTQYLYTRMASSLFEQTAMGKFLTPFTSWPRNFAELLVKWAQGKHPMVIDQWVKATGKPMPNLGFNRKQLLTYMAMLSAAYGVEKSTDLKATQYTGWTSVSTMGQLVGGDLPSLQLIQGLGYLIAGAATADETMIKKGWYEVRPDRFVGIIRQLENIAQGKRDWLDLFFYMQPREEEEGRRTRPRRSESPTRPRR